MPKTGNMVITDGPPFGEYLRELRRVACMSQQDLASRLGRSKQYVSEIERGLKPCPLQHVLRAADILGVTRQEMRAAAARNLLKANGLWVA